MTPFGTIRIEDGCCANNNVFSQEVAFHVRDAFASQLGNKATDPFHFPLPHNYTNLRSYLNFHKMRDVHVLGFRPAGHIQRKPPIINFYVLSTTGNAEKFDVNVW